METTLLATNLSAPMPSAPMQYQTDGSVDWGNMWDSYCLLAQDGGPPHRATQLTPPQLVDVSSKAYQAVTAEIKRGIEAVTGLTVEVSEQAGWMLVCCDSAEHALWMCSAIESENVAARCQGKKLFVPAGEGFTVKSEIKNVITAVAKTHHYWLDHLDPVVKRTLIWEQRLATWKARLTSFVSSTAR